MSPRYKINQFYVVCRNEDDKYKALANIFGTISMGRALIFCHTKASAASLANMLKNDGHSIGLISYDLTKEERTATLKSFRGNQKRVLIVTNVMALVISEKGTVVVNYDLPINVECKEVDYETYDHIIRRTGHYCEGLVINFVDSDRTMGFIKDLEKHFGRKISKLDATDIDEIEKINQE